MVMRYKIIPIVVLITICIFAFILTALLINNKNISSSNKKQNNEKCKNLFNLEVLSDKDIYKSTDEIKIWANLKYIGEKKQVQIWHNNPYVYIKIYDEKGFKTDTIFNDILSKTILERDRIYRFDYVKSGSYSEDDTFWKKFYEEKVLYLPAGEYTIKAIAAFSLTENTNESKCSLDSEIKIKVEP